MKNLLTLKLQDKKIKGHIAIVSADASEVDLDYLAKLDIPYVILGTKLSLYLLITIR